MKKLISAVQATIYILETPSIPPKDRALTVEETTSLLNRIIPAGNKFMQIVQDMAMEAGISNLLGVQVYRYVSSKMGAPLNLAHPSLG